jgi:hypothetical protein
MIRGEANARFLARYRDAFTIAALLAATIHLSGALTALPDAPAAKLNEFRRIPPGAGEPA